MSLQIINPQKPKAIRRITEMLGADDTAYAVSLADALQTRHNVRAALRARRRHNKPNQKPSGGKSA